MYTLGSNDQGQLGVSGGSRDSFVKVDGVNATQVRIILPAARALAFAVALE